MNNIPEGLKKHCPYWYAFLTSQPYTRIGWSMVDKKKGLQLSIYSYPHCIVGEKHGWSYKYAIHLNEGKGCKTCYKLSERFALDNEAKFLETLNKFVRHCDKKHAA